ncbi:MAG: hypothetical protein OXG11_00735, partial [Chloroflexi bacterium]|nr:hypothetical protein [Chloroflexota bacterium]
FEAEQVNESEVVRFPLRDIDAVIMNAPFTDNMKRGRKFGPEAVKGMQRNEIEIRDRLQQTDWTASNVITTNSIRTFFTPLAEWWNSTPTRLMLLNQRSKTLTYPSWSLDQLRQIHVPTRLNEEAWDSLRSAFDKACDIDLLPMQQADECEVRQMIDKAAALACGLEPATVADWRCRLAAEPTITNRHAGHVEVEEARG